jgi:hypothetical protein
MTGAARHDITAYAAGTSSIAAGAVCRAGFAGRGMTVI